MRAPSFSLGIEVILSTISRQGDLRPLPSVGDTAGRKSGTSAGLVVSGQTVIEAVYLKRSSCNTTTGRGLPA
jgi:hypothetical protein